MLVLARAPDESLVLRIDGRDEPAVTFLQMKSGKARLGIDAGIEVVIQRTDLDRENHPEDYPARRPA